MSCFLTFFFGEILLILDFLELLITNSSIKIFFPKFFCCTSLVFDLSSTITMSVLIISFAVRLLSITFLGKYLSLRRFELVNFFALSLRDLLFCFLIGDEVIISDAIGFLDSFICGLLFITGICKFFSIFKVDFIVFGTELKFSALAILNFFWSKWVLSILDVVLASIFFILNVSGFCVIFFSKFGTDFNLISPTLNSLFSFNEISVILLSITSFGRIWPTLDSLFSFGFLFNGISVTLIWRSSFGWIRPKLDSWFSFDFLFDGISVNLLWRSSFGWIRPILDSWFCIPFPFDEISVTLFWRRSFDKMLFCLFFWIEDLNSHLVLYDLLI